MPPSVLALRKWARRLARSTDLKISNHRTADQQRYECCRSRRLPLIETAVSTASIVRGEDASADLSLCRFRLRIIEAAFGLLPVDFQPFVLRAKY